jgi:colicin import membrane protein
MFEAAGNLLAIGLGKLLEGLGSWVSQDLESFGQNFAASAEQALRKNEKEGDAALKNAGKAASRAIFGEDPNAPKEDGPTRRAFRKARERMNPEEQAQRKAERDAKAAEQKAMREAAAEQARRDEAAKKAAAVGEKMAGKQEEIDKIQADKAAALGGKSNEALKANDIRSSEGMAQFIALATGREDPAIEENRKTNAKLEEIRKELAALQQQQVDILGAAA